MADFEPFPTERDFRFDGAEHGAGLCLVDAAARQAAETRSVMNWAIALCHSDRSATVATSPVPIDHIPLVQHRQQTVSSRFYLITELH